jgi:hypothetical protein
MCSALWQTKIYCNISGHKKSAILRINDYNIKVSLLTDIKYDFMFWLKFAKVKSITDIS